MARLGDLVVNIGANTQQLNKELGKVRREMKRFGSNFKSLGRDLTRSVTLPLAGIGAAAVKSAADLESLETSFISLTGGAEQARDMMKQLNEFTAKTPFQIEAVAKSARQLIASGTDVSQVNEQLQFLGDIAATSGSSIDEIAAIFAKVNAKGKVELRNLNQLAERGIPIFKALAEATGLPASELGAGAVSVEEFNKVLKSFSEEGGFAAGAMERLSETASGKFSTALDNLKIAGAELVKGLIPALKKGIDRVTELAQKFSALSDESKNTVLKIGALATAIGPVLILLPQIAAGIKLVIAALTTSNPLILAATIALTGLYVAFGDTSRRASDAADNIKQVTKRLKELNQAELMEEAGIRGKLTEEKLLDNILFSQDFVDEAQARIDEILAQGQRLADGSLGFADKKKLDELKEFRDEHQRIIDANKLLLESLNEIDNNNAYLKQRDAATEAAKAALENKEAVEDLLTTLYDFAIISETFEKAANELDVLLESMLDFGHISETITEQANMVNDAFERLGNQIGDAFARAIVDGDNFGDAMKELFKDIIRALISNAIANAIANASSATNPANQASAGLTIPAFIAQAVGAVTGAFSQVPALAAGGLAFGETMSIVGDNRNAAIDPEVIAPLSKLRDYMGGEGTQVYGRISGDDIVISNERSMRDRNRFG